MVVVLSFGVVVVVVSFSPLDSVSFLSEGLYPGRANINNSKIHKFARYSENIFERYYDKRYTKKREEISRVFFLKLSVDCL